MKNSMQKAAALAANGTLMLVVLASCMAPDRDETQTPSDPGGVCNSGQTEISGYNTDCINGNCCDKWADGSLTEDFKGCLDSYGCATNSGEGGATGEGGAANGGSGQGGSATGGSSQGGSSGVGGKGGAGGSGGKGGAGAGGASGAGGTCTPPVSGPCDNSPQCGCPSGQACYYADPSGTTYCTTPGSMQMGKHCTLEADCAAGLTCTNRVCHRACSTASDCGGTACVSFGNMPEVKFCADACDPVSASGCAAGDNCAPVGGTSASCGWPTANGTSGASCSSTMQCAPGFVCTGAGCSKICKGASDCGGMTCSPFNPPIYVGNQEYGMCS